MIKFTVFGKPVGKQAVKHYFNQKSKKMIGYSPSKTKDWQELIAIQALQHRPQRLLDCPLSVSATFYLIKPKSRRKKDLYPDRKPDHDNLEKALYDALEGIIYINDSRIVEKYFCKKWGDPPRVEIEIKELT
jgi:Holliday junction resolvase RusA-like endonuclease